MKKYFALEKVSLPLRNEISWCPWTEGGDLSPVTPCIKERWVWLSVPPQTRVQSRDTGTCFPWHFALSLCWGLSCKKTFVLGKSGKLYQPPPPAQLELERATRWQPCCPLLGQEQATASPSRQTEAIKQSVLGKQHFFLSLKKKKE